MSKGRKGSKGLAGMPPGPMPADQVAPTPKPRAGFLQDTSAGTLASFRPFLREPADDYRIAWYDATSKTVQAIQNSGWLAGGVEQATNTIAGPMLALNARPDPSIFGVGPPAAKLAAEWSRPVEARFEAWCRSPYECDMYGRHSLGQQCASATKGWFGTGEIVGVVRFKKKPGNSHGTKIMALPSQRIPQTARNRDAIQGVIMDDDGAPVRICYTTINPRNPGIVDEIEVDVRDSMGRPQTIHIHDSPATVVRGLTPLAPVLRVLRQFDQLTNATLTTTLIHALFAATIESRAPTEEAFAALQGMDEQMTGAADASIYAEPGNFSRMQGLRADWYKNTRLDLGVFGKVVHLFPGETLNFKASQSPNANYKDFCRFLLREIARCLGITYEQLSGDREGATYSSERMGGAEAWLQTLYRRQHVSGRFMQIAYEAWLEEDIEMYDLTGIGTPFPGGLPAFLAQRDAASRSDWRGPPKPTADDLKTAKANETLRLNGVLTREQWSAELGTDWQDNDDQRLREQENEDTLKLRPLGKPGQQQVGPDGFPSGGGGGGNGSGNGTGAGANGATKEHRLLNALMYGSDTAVDAALME